MSDIESFADMMGSLVAVQNAPSTEARSVFGVNTLSTESVEYAAHIVEVNGVNRRLTGLDGYCSSVAWLASTSTGNMNRGSIFTLPNGTHPPVQSLTYVHDEDGTVHHTKVVFG